MFRRLSKHLEFRQKLSAARRSFNSLLGVSISQWNTVARVWYITSRKYHHGHYVSCEKNFNDSLIYGNLIQCCGWQQQMNTKVQTLPQSVIVAFCLKIIINYNKLISFSCFSCGSSILVEPGENQQQTQTTYGTEPELNPGHIGGRRALSPLRHPCCPMITVWLSREGTGSKLTLSCFKCAQFEKRVDWLLILHWGSMHGKIKERQKHKAYTYNIENIT